MIIYGIDLSSPSNIADTALAKFRVNDSGTTLTCDTLMTGLTDQQMLDEIHHTQATTHEPIVIGLDCPLSYNDGGGGRASDNELRRRIQARSSKAPLGIGMHPSSIMSPLYISSLTMRGMHVARCLHTEIQLVEVHPGATIGLHMTAREPLPYRVPSCVLTYKQDGKRPQLEVTTARQHILMWMEQVMGMRNIPLDAHRTTHQVDACAAALAAWKYATGQAQWSYPAQPPQHPYPYSC